MRTLAQFAGAVGGQRFEVEIIKPEAINIPSESYNI